MKTRLFTDICAICIILVTAMFFPSTVSAQAMNPVIPGDNLGYLSNNLPDVRYTPVDFMQFYGKDPSEFRGMPGFEEWSAWI